MAATAPPRWRVPLADVIVTDDDISAVAETYRSGWLSMGPRTQEFEAAFAEYVDTPHAIAVSNGTAALHLLALAAGIGPGDEVIVPSLTFVATANAIAYTGATPVFADIVSATEPWLDPTSVEERIGPKTKAILHVAYGGHPSTTVELAQLAKTHGLLFLEDAAHALGGRAGQQALGTFGVAGAFSFFSNKNLAVGEGGMIACSDDEMAARMRLLRSHGMTTLSWDRHRGHATGYDVVALGHNYRIDEARCALALRRLARLDDENAERARIDLLYRELLADVPRVRPALVPTTTGAPAHHLFTVVFDPEINRDEVRGVLNDAGVQTSMHYPPAHHFTIYAAQQASLPVTDAYAASTVTLPMYAHLSDEQVELVVSTLRGAIT